MVINSIRNSIFMNSLARQHAADNVEYTDLFETEELMNTVSRSVIHSDSYITIASGRRILKEILFKIELHNRK